MATTNKDGKTELTLKPYSKILKISEQVIKKQTGRKINKQVYVSPK